MWRTDPADRRRVPAPGGGGALFSSQAFSLKNSGNRTLRAPKRSWRILLDAAGHDNRLAGMTRINLKAMYNDPSQMREALAWRLFGIADSPGAAAHVREAGLRRYLPGPLLGHRACRQEIPERSLRREPPGEPLQDRPAATSGARLSHTGPGPTGMTRGASTSSPDPPSTPTASRPTRTTPRPTRTTTWPASSGRSTASGCRAARNGSIPTPSASRWTAS